MRNRVVLLAVLLALGVARQPARAVQPAAPQGVPGLVLWCDYQQSPCYTGTDRTILSGTNGGSVVVWSDISGSGNDLTLNSPGLLASGSGIYFDATAAYNASLTLSPSNCAIYIVGGPPYNKATGLVGASTGFSDYGQAYYFRPGDNGSPSVTRFGTKQGPALINMMNDESTSQVWDVYSSGTTSTLWRNNNSFTGSYGATNSLLTGFMFGSLNRVGNPVDYIFIGFMKAILVYSPAPTPAQDGTIRQYLQSLYPEVQPAAGQKVYIAVGHSIPWGAELNYIGQEYLNVTATNRGFFPVQHGFPGWEFSDLFVDLPNLATALVPGHENIITVDCATNDVWGGLTAAEVYADMQQECAAIKQEAAQMGIFAKVGFMSMLPRGSPALSGTATFIANETTRETLNAMYRADFTTAISGAGVRTRCFLPNPGVTYADFMLDQGADPILGGSLAPQNATYYHAADETHPVGPGHAIIATYVEAMSPYLPRPNVPLGVAAQSGTSAGQIIVSWDATPGTQDYLLQRSGTISSGFSTIATVPATSSTGTYVYPDDDPTLAAQQTYYYQVASVNVSGTSAFNSPAASALPDVPPTFAGWDYAYYGLNPAPGQGGALDAPLGDGVTNLMKYALGLNPTLDYGQIVSGLPATQPTISGSNEYMELSFDGTATDVTYLVEGANSPAGPWSALYTHASTLAAAPGAVMVTDTVPILYPANRFLRLRATQP